MGRVSIRIGPDVPWREPPPDFRPKSVCSRQGTSGNETSGHPLLRLGRRRGHKMVLADLGRKLNAALSSLNRAPVVDEKVVPTLEKPLWDLLTVK